MPRCVRLELQRRLLASSLKIPFARHSAIFAEKLCLGIGSASSQTDLDGKRPRVSAIVIILHRYPSQFGHLS